MSIEYTDYLEWAEARGIPAMEADRIAQDLADGTAMARIEAMELAKEIQETA